MLTSKQIIDRFNLIPHEAEGGFLGITYQSSIKVPIKDTQTNHSTERTLGSAIYYLLESNGISIMHRTKADIIYHFYSGQPVEMLLIYPQGHINKHEVFVFGNEISKGHLPMKIIPGGTWMGTRVLPGGEYSLMGVTMSPGFHLEDYEIGKRESLIQNYPELKTLITKLTHEDN